MTESDNIKPTTGDDGDACEYVSVSISRETIQKLQAADDEWITSHASRIPSREVREQLQTTMTRACRRLANEVLAALVAQGPVPTAATGIPKGTMGLWRMHGIAGGKYLVQRRDGSVPAWPYFVLGARDPAAPAALRAYAEACTALDATYREDVRRLANEFEWYRAAHGAGDPDATPHRKDDPATVAKMAAAKGA